MKPARLLLVVPLLVAACGGSNMREAAEPSRSDAPSPTTIEEAQDQIAEAQARLGGPTEEKPADKPAPAPQVTPAPPAAESSDSKKKDEAPKGGSVATSPCESPCRAFASMKRAVESLCRMTGETDERCIRARRTLETSTSRVATCLCR